jgi:hypothetical protein
MNKSYIKLCNLLEKVDVLERVPYVLHHHFNARNTNEHFDLRFVDPFKKNELLSFAIPGKFNLNKGFPKEKKLIMYKTRPHPMDWLKKANTYRMNLVEEGEIKVITSSINYYALEFMGRRLRGKFKVFKLKKSRRDDAWMMVKI